MDQKKIRLKGRFWMDLKGSQTEKNLLEAFAGESQAHMKYLIFADVAEREGKLNVARLFRAISYAERVHATNHLKALKGITTLAEIERVTEGKILVDEE